MDEKIVSSSAAEEALINATDDEPVVPLASSPSSAQSAADGLHRNALLFSPSLSEDDSFPQQQNEQTMEQEEDEHFYEITAEDLRLMYKALRDESKRHSSLLPTKLLKERDQQLKERAYKRTIVRFRLLHTGHILQAQFLSNEPVSALFTFLDQLISPTVRFELRQIPSSAGGPLRAGDHTTSLLEAGIAPKSVLILTIAAVPAAASTAADQQKSSSPPNNQPPLGIDQIVVPGRCRTCTQQEAVASAEEWLSSNTEFRPYLSTILDILPSTDGSTTSVMAPSTTTMPTRHAVVPPASRRPAEDECDSDERRDGRSRSSRDQANRTTAPELPKWMKLTKRS